MQGVRPTNEDAHIAMNNFLDEYVHTADFALLRSACPARKLLSRTFFSVMCIVSRHTRCGSTYFLQLPSPSSAHAEVSFATKNLFFICSKRGLFCVFDGHAGAEIAHGLRDLFAETFSNALKKMDCKDPTHKR